MNSGMAVAWLDRAISIFDRSRRIFWLMNTIPSSLLFLVMCLAFVDVMLRYFFNRPLNGVSETEGLLVAIVVFWGMALVSMEKRHVNIDIFSSRLTHKGRIIFNMIVSLCCSILLALMAWQSVEFGLLEKKLGSIVAILDVPTFPFLYMVAFGCLISCLVFLRHFLESVVEGLKLHFGVRLWIISFGIIALLTAMMTLWLQPALWQFDPYTLGIISIVVCLFGLVSGVPVAFGFFILSFLLLAHASSLQASYTLVGVFPFKVISTFTWAVIALFIIMGYEVLYAGLGADLYDSAQKWLGRLPGGLAIATIGAGAAFAAMVGDAASSTVTLTLTGLPEMKRYKYDVRMATGCIAATATLGPLIPPSITFIVYGIATQTSIGDLFMAGIFPGLLLVFSMSVYIYIRCWLNPSMGPRGAPSSYKAKLLSLKVGLPVFIIFILVIGGIYAGIFSPGEGAAIGGVAVLIIGLILRRYTPQKLLSAIIEAGKLSSMTFLIIIGALMFSYFLASSGVAGGLAGAIVRIQAPPWVLILLISSVYLVLGFFVDPIAIMIITLPIFFPVAKNLGWDPVWFGVITTILLNLGLITPPFSPICFIMKGVAPDVSIGTMFQGLFPFVLITLLVVIIVIAFPQIATFLPDALR